MTPTAAGLTMYVIYSHPADFPKSCVCRVWHGMTPEPGLPHIIGPTVADVRAMLPVGLTNIGRHPDDEAAIAEVWI